MKRMTLFGCVVAAAGFCVSVAAQPAMSAEAAVAARSLSTKVECAVPGVLPNGPSSLAQIAEFTGSWGLDDRFDAIVWREGCPSDAGASILYLRVTQLAGTSFVCGLQVGQAGALYDTRLVQNVTHAAFCDNIPGPTTFVIDQYPDNPQFDNNGAATFTFKGAYGQVYTVNLPAFGAGSSTVLPAVGLWWNPAESGTGYALDSKHGVLVVTTYSYTATGAAVWYISSGPIVGNTFNGTLDKFVAGQCIACAYRAPAAAGSDGAISIVFSTPSTATLTLPGGRVVAIVPQAF